MDKQVVNFESHTALFCDKEGLGITLDILLFSKEIIKPGGHIYLELDPRRIEMLRKVIEKNSFIKNMQVFSDIFGKDRFVKIQIK